MLRKKKNQSVKIVTSWGNLFGIPTKKRIPFRWFKWRNIKEEILPGVWAALTEATRAVLVPETSNGRELQSRARRRKGVARVHESCSSGGSVTGQDCCWGMYPQPAPWSSVERKEIRNNPTSFSSQPPTCCWCFLSVQPDPESPGKGVWL